jgi:PAS domain S-box-containing protein
MEDETKTKVQLINELQEQRQRVILLEETNTRHKQLDGGAKKRRERHREFFESMTAKIFHIDLEGRIVRATKTAAGTLGLSAKDIVGKTLYDMLPPNDASKLSIDNEKIIKSGKPKLGVIEEYSLLSTGKKGWIESDKIPYYDNKGDIAGLIVYATDITEHKKAQEALFTSQFQLSAAMDLARIVYWEVDPTNRIFTFNDPFYSFYGTTAEEQGGYRMTRDEYAKRFIHPEDTSLFYRMVEENDARKDREFFADLEHRIIRSDGEVRTIIARTRFVRDGKGRTIRIYGANQDITEVKRAQEDKRHLELQLLQAQKMEALGTLAGGIAHDFNNILEGIIGFAEMVKEDASADSPQHRRIALVLKGAKRGRDLVKQILAFCRQSRQEQKPVALSEIVEEGLRLLRPTLPSTIEIRFKDLASNDTIYANPGQMHQVLMNLCTNAAHAMREKGGFLEINISQVGFTAGDPLLIPDMQPGV